MEEFLRNLLENYPVLAPIIFVIARSLAIIIPPITGIIIDLLGIITFGWFWGMVYAELGIALGTTVAFVIGRFFKEPLVKRFVALQNLNKWESEIDENKKFWYLTGFRFLTSPFFDYVSYAAGLTNIRFGKYLLSTILGTLPLMFATYYFGEKFISLGNYIAIIFIAAAILAGYVFKKWSKKHYDVDSSASK